MNDTAIHHQPSSIRRTSSLGGSRGEIRKIDRVMQNVFGWAYVTHLEDGTVNVDHSGDFVDDVGELEGAAYDFVLHSRVGDTDHQAVQTASLIESFVLTPAKRAALGMPSGATVTGWWVGFHITDPRTWQRVQDGDLLAFSIAGRWRRVPTGD